MAKLKEVLQQKIQEHRPRTQKLVKEHGDLKIGEVTVAQAIGGARGVRMLVTDISYLDPFEGIRFRGKTIPETFAALPKVPGCDYPYVEGFWWFLLTGDVPTDADVQGVVEDWKARRDVPAYVLDILRAMPKDSHPMTMFSAAIVSMQRESLFVKRYNEGMKKDEHWDPMFEDSTNLLARLPSIAAAIYRLKYKDDKQIKADPKLDWAATSRTRWVTPSRTTTSPGCTSSSTPTTSRATCRRTRRTSSRRRCPMPTTRCRPASTAWPARFTASPTRRCCAGS